MAQSFGDLPDLVALVVRVGAIGERGHQSFALMHRFNHVQLREPGMRDLAFFHGTRNHADHFAARGEAGIRHGAHQADVGATVNESNAALGKQAAQSLGCSTIGRTIPHPGTTENTNSHAK